jgi:hypothetical protein
MAPKPKRGAPPAVEEVQEPAFQVLSLTEVLATLFE